MSKEHIKAGIPFVLMLVILTVLAVIGRPATETQAVTTDGTASVTAPCGAASCPCDKVDECISAGQCPSNACSKAAAATCTAPGCPKSRPVTLGDVSRNVPACMAGSAANNASAQ